MNLKGVMWVGKSKSDLESLPGAVRRVIGFALFQAQKGEKSPKAKPLSGFGGADILEIVEDNVGGTYRGVYTVKFEGIIAVLHVFQKKAHKGRKTLKQEIELVKQRFKLAKEQYEEWLKTKGKKS